MAILLRLVAWLAILFVLVGANVRKPARIAPVKAFQNKEGSLNSLYVHVTTFNVGAADPPADLRDWIIGNGPTPDVVAFGLQEMVDLNPIKALREGKARKKIWIDALSRALNDYEEIEHKRLVGMFLMVMRKKTLQYRISDVSRDKVGTGTVGFGNKGGVGISFSLSGFNLVFVNCHLAAHSENAEQRSKDFQSIAKGLKFTNKNAKTVYDHDVIIWMGDTNSRLDTSIENNYARQMVKDNRHHELIQHDQLKAGQQAKKAFVGFTEATIAFRPTFKYDVGTNDFDTSEKQRVPAWCDRILHWKKSPSTIIDQLTYTSLHDVKISDHKPVQSLHRVMLHNAACSGATCAVAEAINTAP